MNFVEAIIYAATEQMRVDCNAGHIHVDPKVWTAAMAFRLFFFPRRVLLHPDGQGRWNYQ